MAQLPTPDGSPESVMPEIFSVPVPLPGGGHADVLITVPPKAQMSRRPQRRYRANGPGEKAKGPWKTS